MLHLSIPKDLFENILSGKQTQLIKDSSKHWQKKLLEPHIIEDKIYYEVTQVEQLSLSNGLGEEKPAIVIECNKIVHNREKNIFIFELGKILQHKNTNIEKHKDELIEQLLKEKRALEETISKDHLTQTYNRMKMEMDLNEYIYDPSAKELCAVFVDADHFKDVNDMYGHDIGDRALQYIANKLKLHAEELKGEVYRYGGEEFIILCFYPEAFLLDKLEQLRQDIKKEIIPHPFEKITLTVSMGVSFWKDSYNKEEFIKKADEGVYRAKNRGRDQIIMVK